MAAIHVLKKTKQEVVLKIYRTDSGGGTEQIEPYDPTYILADGQGYANTAEIDIQEIYWGAKKDKQIDINRVNDPVANTVHGHYYFINSGHHKFVGFNDNSYANGAIRVVGDGPFHVILKLRKSGFPEL
jgi:hypothetical protein